MLGVFTNHVMGDVERRNLIFDGNILLQGRDAASMALADHAEATVREYFAPLEPQHAQFSLAVDEFVKIAGTLKSHFTNHNRTKELVRDLLGSYGCDLDDTYFDVPRLRIVPSGGYLSSGVSYAYKAHRDIWYASPTAQVNWWMPVFPVTPERAMSFFPDYWERTLENSSAEFDYAEWCRVGRSQAMSQIKEDTRKHPLPLEPVETRSEIRFAGSKGDLIIFSAAHLHATAPNVSGVTRFSIDFRTLSRDDLINGRGAPILDSKATGSTLGDFLRASDFAPFPMQRD